MVDGNKTRKNEANEENKHLVKFRVSDKRESFMISGK
jgi:hypothetical protein